MKQYTCKTLEECLAQASSDYGISESQIIYKLVEEKKGLFSKKTVIEVYDANDAAEYAMLDRQDFLEMVTEL